MKVFISAFLNIAVICLLLNISVKCFGERDCVNPFFINHENCALTSGAKELLAEQNEIKFEENKGQLSDVNGVAAPYILFKASTQGINIYITTSGLSWQFYKLEEDEHNGKKNEHGKRVTVDEGKSEGEWHRVDMILKGAVINKENIITESDVTACETTYYYGHCPDGIFHVKSFSKITIRNVYPDIDWALYTSAAGGIKHDFIVHPGADPALIKLVYEGSGRLTAGDHEIYFENELGNVNEGTLLCYQGNPLNEVTSDYTVKETGKKIKKGFSYEVSISTGRYNTSEDLVIDPQLQWGTYYGGFAYDGARGMTVDDNGNVFITGYSNSTNFFPIINAGGGTYYQGTNAGSYDIFILKFNPGGVLQWATYYGGTGDEAGLSLASNGSGNIFITGYTTSGDMPVLNPGGGAYYHGTNASIGSYGVFLLEFSNNGTRLWATYFGDGVGTGSELTVDRSGNVFVTGYSDVSGMPAVNAGGGSYFQAANAGGSDVFILKFSNSQTLLWSTYYGGTDYELGYSIASDASGNVFVTGYTSSTNLPTCNPGGGAYFQSTKAGGNFDLFLLKFSNNGLLTWATYYGGNGDEFGNDLVIDNNGNLFVTGATSSANFPTQNAGTYFDNSLSGTHDIIIMKFSNTCIRIWSTLYGGSGLDMGVGDETGYSIAADASDNVYVTGYTSSNNFPTLNPGGGAYFKGSNSGGAIDSYFIEFSNDGTRLWATYNGTNQIDFGTAIATYPGGALFTAGEWQSSGSNGLLNPGGGAYYVTSFSGSDDSYVMKFLIPSPLPVEWLSFTAECTEDKSALLQWQTASETNNDYFSVQRSSTGHDFENIGTVNGSGNSTTISSYSFIDKKPLKGMAYYRLQQTDYNGEKEVSKIIVLPISCEKISEPVVYPNPANNFIMFYDGSVEDFEIEIFNTLGETVIKVQNQNKINISFLPAGIYSMKIIRKYNSSFKKFIKQ